MRDENQINWQQKSQDWKCISVGNGENYQLLASVSQESNDPRVLNPGKWFGSVLSSDEGSYSAPIFDTERDVTNFVEAMFLLDWDFATWDRVIPQRKRDDNDMAYHSYHNRDRDWIIDNLQQIESGNRMQPIIAWDVEILDEDGVFLSLSNLPNS